MKLFNSLQFASHVADPAGTHAVIEFDNGYGASVVTGDRFYTSSDKPYELAVTWGGGLCYGTPITDDVLGYLDAAEVEDCLQQIKALPAASEAKPA